MLPYYIAADVYFLSSRVHRIFIEETNFSQPPVNPALSLSDQVYVSKHTITTRVPSLWNTELT